MTQRPEMRSPASTLSVWRLTPRDYDGESPHPTNIVVAIVAIGHRASAHSRRLTHHAESWLTTRFALDVHHCDDPLPEDDIGGALTTADLVFLVSDKGARLDTGLPPYVLGESSDKCLHLDLERTAGELWQSNVGPAPHPMVSFGATSFVTDQERPECALSGVVEALLVGLFRHGIVGVDCADYLDAFSGGPWYAYHGFGRASGVNRATSACSNALAALEQQRINLDGSDIAVVIVAVPEKNPTLPEFEQVVSILERRYPGAIRLVSAPVGSRDSLEVVAIAARKPSTGHPQRPQETHE